MVLRKSSTMRGRCKVPAAPLLLLGDAVQAEADDYMVRQRLQELVLLSLQGNLCAVTFPWAASAPTFQRRWCWVGGGGWMRFQPSHKYSGWRSWCRTSFTASRCMKLSASACVTTLR